MNLARKTAQQGVQFKTPVFDGANMKMILSHLLNELNLPR